MFYSRPFPHTRYVVDLSPRSKADRSQPMLALVDSTAGGIIHKNTRRKRPDLSG